MRRVLPEGALPVRKGQVWRDRDKRSPALVRIIGIGEQSNRVHYDRGVVITNSDLNKFVKRFDFVSNP